jgi:hypothetical protein
MGAALGGRLSSSFAGDAVARGGWVGATGVFRSVMVLVRGTSKLEGTVRWVPTGDNDGGGWAWARGSIDFISVIVK